MAGHIHYGQDAYRLRPVPWLEPLLLLSNAALYGAYRLVASTLEVQFAEPFIPQSSADETPLIYMCWHRMDYLCVPILELLPAEKRPTLVMHDGVASRAFSHHTAVWMDFQGFAFRRRAAISPRQQIIAYIQDTGRPILILPDSGGPYGVMKPGILEVARAVNARLVPFAVAASRTWTVGKELQHAIPLRHSRLSVRRGEPLSCSASLSECQRALDACTRDATYALGQDARAASALSRDPGA